jgi:small subunit ribosomal protein S20
VTVANHPQALKRHRQSLKARARNRHYRSVMRGAVKKVRAAIEEGADKAALEGLFRSAESTLHRVAQKGVIGRNTASRKISRLAAAVQKATQG